MLFPEVLEDYITEENAVRFIDVLIEGLDLCEIGIPKSDTQGEDTTAV